MERIYMLWNLSAIPAGATITNANMSWYSYYADSIPYYVWNTTQNWDESNLTWNNMPSNATIQASGTFSGKNKWYYFNITNATITAFAQNKNVSIIMTSPETPSVNFYADFRSREYNATDATKTPQLNVSYTTASNTGNCGWTNDTAVAISGTNYLVNTTKLVNSTVGATIAWCYYFNDTSNNWNGTSCSNPFTYNTSTSAPPTDTCTYSGSGDFVIDCSENCVVDTNADLGGNTLRFINSGTVYINADITNVGSIEPARNCIVTWAREKELN